MRMHAVASSSVLLQVHCLNLSTCIGSKPCVILRISCIRSFVVLHRQYSVLDILSVLVVPVPPDLDLDSSSVLDLKHMAFPDHSLDLNMQFLNMPFATLKSLTSLKTLACTSLNSTARASTMTLIVSSCRA